MTPDWAAKPTDVPYADLDDPQSLNLYGYVRNNPLSHADADGLCCDDLWNFLGGAANAFGSDFFAGAGRQDSSNADYQSGQNVGDALAMDVGRLEALGGGTIDVASIPLDTVGVGELIQVGATAMAVQGTTAVVTGGARLLRAATNGSSGGRTAGENLTPSQRAEDAGKKCTYCGKATTEKPGKPNARETDHKHPRSRNGNTTPNNRAPACRTCNRQKGNRTPKEWKKAKKLKKD